MNHIIAALYVIGISFAIWAGIHNTADVDQVSAEMAAAERIMLAAIAAGDDPGAVSAQLTELGGPLETLIAEDVRLPTSLSARLRAFNDTRSGLLEDIESGSGDWQLRWERAQRTWADIEPERDLDETDLVMASLSVQGNTLFTEFTNAAEIAVEICISLIGIMALWLGLMRVAEEAGLIQLLATIIRPILRLLFPKVPKGHPAEGAVMMSMAANIMGLDNAATPLGLNAMKELQTLNSSDDTITDDQIMLLALNTSSVNLIPFTVIAYRVSEDSVIPSSIIIPTIIATSASTIVAVTMVKVMQRWSTDPALTGAAADAVRDRLVAELEAAAHGENSKEKEEKK